MVVVNNVMIFPGCVGSSDVWFQLLLAAPGNLQFPYRRCYTSDPGPMLQYFAATVAAVATATTNIK